MVRLWSLPVGLAAVAVAASSTEAPAPSETGTAATTMSCASTCDASDEVPGPDLGPKRPWRRALSNVYSLVDANDEYSSLTHHRGRDMMTVEGQPQWVIGKFTYGLTDKDLKGEEVDVYVQRGCASTWEKLGTAITTDERGHEPVEGVEDSGGRIYFEVPQAKALGVGRHRIRLVVAGDHSSADMLFEVVRKDTPVFVSDVDGTLTSAEFIEFRKLLEGNLPRANPHAAEVFNSLTAKGYRPIYLTARPEWLTSRTRDFLAKTGFPPGIIHTTTTLTGALWSEAAKFKAKELKQFTAKGLNIRWAFGNQPSDSEAYEGAGFGKDVRCIFYKVLHPLSGQPIEGYDALLPDVAADPVECNAELAY